MFPFRQPARGAAALAAGLDLMPGKEVCYMKSLFSDNRLANMLHLFHNTQTMSVNNMAAKLGVSDRTIRNDIKQLNQTLSGCALIEGYQGRYTLRVFDADKFRKILSEISEADEFLNSPRNRMDYMFGKLMRAEMPLLIDDLAYEMSIGRTTLTGDLKKLRSELEEYRLSVPGKTSQGISLYGNEFDIRRYVLENNFDQIYGSYPLDRDIEELIVSAFAEKHLEIKAQKNFRRFVILMLDRFLTGHYIGQISEKSYDLTSRTEFSMVNEIIDRIGGILQMDFPVEEKLFTLLPVIGMRTPADAEGMRSIELDESVRPLLPKITERIRREMNLSIDMGDFTEEFLYHLMFMINRLRFGIKLPNPMLEDIREKYPLAYQMAGVAGKVISKEYGLKTTEDEQAFLATYFGVMLTESQLKMEKLFSIAAVYTTGRITSRLVEMQLRRIIDTSSSLTMLASEDATTEKLDEYDLVLTTVKLPHECHRPIIEINEIFNEQELRHKIEKARYWDQVESPTLDSNWFVMAGFLDEEQFFYLKDETTYESALDKMVDKLTYDGLVDEEFEDRLYEREKQGTMVFDNAIALPHAIQKAGDRIVLAIGVFPKVVRHRNNDIRVIFLLGIPEQVDGDDNLLIRLYDEIITISQDPELRERIISSTSYQDLQRALYRQAD